MLHLLLYVLLAIIVAGGLFLAATRFLPAGEQIAPPLRDEPLWQLPPERPLVADDVDGVRLPVALRGYRFAETDALLDRLAAELRGRDDEIARLRGDDVAEPADAELVEAELVEGEQVEGEQVEGEPAGSDAARGESADGAPADDEPADDGERESVAEPLRLTPPEGLEDPAPTARPDDRD